MPSSPCFLFRGVLAAVFAGALSPTFAADEAFKLGKQLDYERVASTAWPKVCEQYKQALTLEPKAFETFAGTVDIAKLGDWSWNVQRVNIGVPIESGGEVIVGGASNDGEFGGWVKIKGEDRQSLWLTYRPDIVDDNYWDGPDQPPSSQQLALSQTLFGEQVKRFRMYIDLFGNTPIDLKCRTESQADDAPLIHVLLQKRRPARDMLPTDYGPMYRVKQNDWTGMYQCGPNPNGTHQMFVKLYSSGELFVETAGHVFQGLAVFQGPCPTYDQIAL